jgi:hypothetical protein
MESLQLRIAKAGDEMKFADGFDFVLSMTILNQPRNWLIQL